MGKNQPEKQPHRLVEGQQHISNSDPLVVSLSCSAKVLRVALHSAGATDSAGISAMTVSPNRHLLALAERGERPTVTVYDLTAMKKRKVLTHTEAGTKVQRTQLTSRPEP